MDVFDYLDMLGWVAALVFVVGIFVLCRKIYIWFIELRHRQRLVDSIVVIKPADSKDATAKPVGEASQNDTPPDS